MQSSRVFTITRRRLLVGAAAASAGALTSLMPSSIGTSNLHAKRMPQRVCLYQQGKLPLGVDRKRLVRALQRYVDDFLGPVWGVTAQLSWTAGPVPGALNVALVDTFPQDDLAGTIAYHEFETVPDALVSVLASYQDEGSLSMPVSHELGEMLVNPGVNMWAGFSPLDQSSENPETRMRALEIADPVQRFSFPIDGFQMSDFVYPAYFEPWRDGQLDYCGAIKGPGEIAPGGYQIIRNSDKLTETTNDPPEMRCFRHGLITNPRSCAPL